MRIGDDIEVTVMAVNGSQVRIGINAPRDIAVDREEIAERKRRDREAGRRRPQAASAKGAPVEIKVRRDAPHTPAGGDGKTLNPSRACKAPGSR